MNVPGLAERILNRRRNRPTAEAVGRLAAPGSSPRHLHRLARRIALDLASGGDEPPTELRIFKAGANETTKGTFFFTSESAELVMQAAEDWGNEFSFDYEHSALFPVDNGPAPAAGWFRLEVRDTSDGPELWAVDIRWTDRARELIEAKEVRYISPAFATDREGRITSLINVALTNLPATKDLEPLVAASLQALAVDSSLSVDEILDQVRSLLRARHPHLADGWTVDVFLDRVVIEIADGRTYLVPITIDGDTISLAGEPTQVRREWVPLTPDPQPAPEGSNEMKVNAATLVALGLAGTASDAEIQTAVERGAETLQALRNLVPDGQDVLGTVTAWRDAAQKVEALTARVAELETADRQRQLDELLKDAVAQGKVTPGQVDALKGLFTSDAGAVNLEGLTAYIAASPRVVALTGPAAREPVVATSAAGGAPAVDVAGKKWADLTNVERHNLRVTDPETFQRLLEEHRQTN